MKGVLETPHPETVAPDATADSQSPQQGGTLVYAPFVRVMTFVIIAVVVAMMSLIYARWATVREPSSAVVILADQTQDGTKIEVKGYKKTWNAVLNEENRYETPILLDPGHYTIKVTHKKDVLLSTDFIVESLRGCQYILSPAVEIIGPPAATGNVQLTLEMENPQPNQNNAHQELTLSLAQGYHKTAYLSPGEYRATATQDGRVISRDVFTVQMYHPLTVKLGQAPPQ
jgi:hypothetical protein